MSDFITQQPLILASASKSRQQLLRALGLQFDQIPSRCDEDAIKGMSMACTASELAASLAASKALVVSEDYPEHFVLGADQLCVLGEQYFDKPGNHEVAKTQLRKLSGHTHQQISACCIVKGGTILWAFQDIALLTMRPLSDRAIEAYLLAEKPYQSCGAYHYEGQAKWLFTQVQGSDSTIQGLPIQFLIQGLLKTGAITLY